MKVHLHIDQANLSLHLQVKFLKPTKTDEGTTLHIQSTCDITCPYALTIKFLKLHPNYTWPLFCYLGDSPITRYQFPPVLNKAISAFNLDTYAYNSLIYDLGKH